MGLRNRLDTDLRKHEAIVQQNEIWELNFRRPVDVVSHCLTILVLQESLLSCPEYGMFNCRRDERDQIPGDWLTETAGSILGTTRSAMSVGANHELGSLMSNNMSFDDPHLLESAFGLIRLH